MINTGKLAGRTLFITGASRGIGKAIALKAAVDGANIVIAAKTVEAQTNLPGTIYSAAEEIQKAGGRAHPCVVDVRDEIQVRNAVKEAVEKFGGIDILVNNASAISLTPTQQTDMKKYDLMQNINTRGTFLVSKECLPYLSLSNHAHILNISPPLNLNSRWFAPHVAYTIAKYGMSMCVLGMAEEFRKKNIAVNALWPRTAVHTAAIEMLAGSDSVEWSRKPDIMADAAYAILMREPSQSTGNFFIDDEVLAESGVTNLTSYACNPNNVNNLMPDFFLDSNSNCSNKSRAEEDGNNNADTISAKRKISLIFEKIEQSLSPDIVSKTQAIYQFNVEGDEKGIWYLDLKNGKGACGNGAPTSAPDATLTMSSKNFYDMFAGKLKTVPAFMTGKLKISGDLQKAMKLEKLMKLLKSKF